MKLQKLFMKKIYILTFFLDGVCDVLSNAEIVKSICQCENPKEAAERLVDQALLYSCEDNATVTHSGEDLKKQCTSWVFRLKFIGVINMCLIFSPGINQISN